MANKILGKAGLPEKLQGTDGVRGVTCPANHPSVSGLSPVDAFLKKGMLTEEFVELYTFCYIKLLEQKGAWRNGQEVVIGWDPRDTQGIYHQTAIRGVRRAGAKAVAVGILPTSAIPLYLLHREAAGGIMVTASHNPPDQNGIKLFSKNLGLKPLPGDDLELSTLIYHTPYASLSNCPVKGSYENAYGAALDLWYQFFGLPTNTWLEDKSLLGHLLLVIDPAYGCLRGIASHVFKQLGVNKIIEVSNDSFGQVNVKSGVIILEGIREIDSQFQSDSGDTLKDSCAIQTIFEMGRKHRNNILEGILWVAGAVFDADGDRFFRLDYDPIEDRIIVLSGDEIAYHQAKYLINRFPTELLGAPYVNTVESDLNSCLAAAELGFRPVIEAVGDKWIQIQVILSWLESHLDHTGRRRLEELKQKGISTNAEIEDLLSRVNSSCVPRGSATDHSFSILRGYSIGSEASGHVITPGLINTKADDTIPVFIGDGLKSAINVFVATESLYNRSDVGKYIDSIHMPFPCGFKKSLQVYYTDKTRFYNSSPLWQQLEETIKETSSGLWVKKVHPQEPNMLYLSLNEPHGGQRGALFIRNSGTEEKTVISLRGSREDHDKLFAVGEAALKLLYQDMKDQNHSYTRGEVLILKTLKERGPCSPDDLVSVVSGINWERLLIELSKQRLIEYRSGNVCLTGLGYWYIQETF